MWIEVSVRGQRLRTGQEVWGCAKAFARDETTPAYAMVQIKNPAEFNERYAQFVHPIMEAALAWYNSSDYEPLKQLRLNELTSLVLVTGISGYIGHDRRESTKVT